MLRASDRNSINLCEGLHGLTDAQQGDNEPSMSKVFHHVSLSDLLFASTHQS